MFLSIFDLPFSLIIWTNRIKVLGISNSVHQSGHMQVELVLFQLSVVIAGAAKSLTLTPKCIANIDQLSLAHPQ